MHRRIYAKHRIKCDKCENLLIMLLLNKVIYINLVFLQPALTSFIYRAIMRIAMPSIFIHQPKEADT